MSEYYHWFKAHGLCARCGKIKPARNHVYCLECMSYDAEKARKYRLKTPDYNERHRKAQAQKYSERREQGLCTLCGKRKPENGFARCGVCRARLRQYAAKYRLKKGMRTHDERMEHDRCYYCGDKAIEGKRLCAKCKGQAMQNLKGANKKINWYHHPWRDIK